MLVLKRRVGETLMIGSNISVTVLERQGDKISLGINAPKEISVHREEIFKKLSQEHLVKEA